MELHLVGGGGVMLEAVIALDRQLPGVNVQNDVSKAAAIVLVSEGNKCFEVVLQIGDVVTDSLVLTPRITLAVITLGFFGRSTVAVAIKMNRYEGHTRGGQLVALRQDRGLCRGLSGLKRLLVVLLRLFHCMILPIRNI